jgi:hypothetical protein
MTPSLSIREGTPRDREAILALRKIVFPTDHPEKQDSRFWDWQFVDSYAGRGRFFVAECDGRLVGHCGFLRQQFVGRDVLRGAIEIDAMTHPQFRGLRVFSQVAAYGVEQMRGDIQVITAFQIRKAVLAGALAGGLREAGSVRILLKPLVFSFSARADEDIRPVHDGELQQIDALLQTTAIRQPRTVEFLKWRYRSNPAWRYEIDGVFDRGEMRAFLVHRATTLRRIKTLALVDAGFRSGHARALRRLLAHAGARGRRHGLKLAAALLTKDHPAYRTFRQALLIPGPHRFRLLLRAVDDDLQWIEKAPWSLSWGDTDHL